jgi:hypothetical protein
MRVEGISVKQGDVERGSEDDNSFKMKPICLLRTETDYGFIMFLATFFTLPAYD